MASSVISQALKAFKSSSVSLCFCLLWSVPFSHLFWLLLCLTCDFSADAGAVHPSGGTYSLFSLTSHREGRLGLVLNDVISDRDAPIDRQSDDSEPIRDITIHSTHDFDFTMRFIIIIFFYKMRVKTNDKLNVSLYYCLYTMLHVSLWNCTNIALVYYCSFVGFHCFYYPHL